MIFERASRGPFRLKGIGGKREKVYYLKVKKKIFDQQKNFIEICSRLKHFNIDGKHAQFI